MTGEHQRDNVLDCASRLALWTFATFKSASGLAQSKTWRRFEGLFDRSKFFIARVTGAYSKNYCGVADIGVSVTGPSRPQSVNGQLEASKGL